MFVSDRDIEITGANLLVHIGVGNKFNEMICRVYIKVNDEDDDIL